ncbi:iron-containing alcohol dehydrogenase [Paraburkholderia sp. 1N]|uniref:Iron-containing alcohol dehydrogenase n=1 Tax=Paraburkholderia solitsugae TaxID=2675748 RepID=A0ABX2BLT6_9BURK|nr:maleylacetate reductase [Paraburkholderia solitsugae]NPT41904.1 iron-containing alcohol dehydrogenase [Paraburkholderia solitsugae]
MKTVFDFFCHSPTVLFGAGRFADLPVRLEQLGKSRVLLITTTGGARRYRAVADVLASQLAASFDGAVAHCPIEIAHAALKTFRTRECDVVVTVGGGSTIGLGKYIAVETGAPHITLPTTLSGSEMTPLFGVLVDGEKRSRREPNALANTVIVDPALAQSLPIRETATTGMNALAHCIEALYVPKSNPLTSQLALTGIDMLYRALKKLADEPTDLEARTQAAYGATIGGLMINSVGIGMHHRICHILGGRFKVPHGESNCVVLPHVLAYNAPAIPEACATMESVMGAHPAVALQRLVRDLGAPVSLRELDVPADSIAAIADESFRHIDHNPLPVDEAAVLKLLQAAWAGQEPSVR